MALSNYIDVYNVEDYVERVELIQSALSSGMIDQEIEFQKDRIKNQIEVLKAKEAKLFSKFKNVRNIEELNQRLEVYKKAVINFSGINLKNIFIGQTGETKRKELEAFKRAIISYINNYSFTEKDLKAFKNMAYNKAMAILNKELNRSGKNKLTGHSGYNDNGTILPQNFTFLQQEGWKQIFLKAVKEGKASKEVRTYVETYLNTSQTPDISINSSSSENQAKIKIEMSWWEKETLALTPTEAKKLSSEELTRINTTIRHNILSAVQGAENTMIINDIISEILRLNPYVFFVGQNANEITGILGEIASMYYLSVLIGEFDRSRIIWRGGTHSGAGNKKPHQDILFEDFGIQVKNSTKDFVNIISFASAGIQTMLDKTELSDDVKKLFINYYGTQNFNLPYHKDESSNMFVEGAPATKTSAFGMFELSSKALDDLEAQIQTLLNLSAAAFMYMDISEGLDGIDANVLYYISGVAFQTASNILSDIIENIDKNKQNMRVRVSHKTSNNHTIITESNKSKKTKNASSFALTDIILTSSYNFASLLKG